MSDPIRETLEPPAPADPSDFQTLQGIALDMVESLRPIVLPEILGVLRRAIKQAHAPAPAANGELAQWLERIGDDYDDLYRPPSALIRPKLARAAALLRQLPPEGLEAIQYWAGDDGAVIQRTLRAPESWAIRAGSACMSTTGEWDIEPMPSERTDEWLANHRWPSAAAAWEALQQARRQEVGDE